MNTDPMSDIFDLMGRVAGGSMTKNEYEMTEWKHDGMLCQTNSGGYGSICGYVRIPKGHPGYGKDYYDSVFDNISVHGGITFAGEGRDGSGDWFVGFDTMHAGDTPEIWTEEAVIKETENFASQLSKLIQRN